jgi:ABC-type multidrug transport system permease subunit
MSIGIFVSSFAKTEFQAVQFLPAILFPQLLLSGLLASRNSMPSILRVISDYLPLTYAVDATQKVVAGQGALTRDFLLLAIFLFALLAAGALTLKRKTK